MSGGKDKATKPSSSYKIGDRTVANTYWNGNDYVTQYNPTSGESEAMQTLQSAIPQAYTDATDEAGIEGYKQRWIDNQVNQLNELTDKNLTNLKDKLITGGQVGSSTGWNKIGALSDSYMDSLNDISTNADVNALNYQNGLLGYANNLQNSMNNYYNLASQTAQNTANNQQSAANQNLQYTSYNNSLGSTGSNLLSAGLGLVGTLGGAALGGPIGSSLGSALGNKLGSLAGKTGG